MKIMKTMKKKNRDFIIFNIFTLHALMVENCFSQIFT